MRWLLFISGGILILLLVVSLRPQRVAVTREEAPSLSARMDQMIEKKNQLALQRARDHVEEDCRTEVMPQKPPGMPDEYFRATGYLASDHGKTGMGEMDEATMKSLQSLKRLKSSVSSEINVPAALTPKQ